MPGFGKIFIESGVLITSSLMFSSCCFSRFTSCKFSSVCSKGSSDLLLDLLLIVTGFTIAGFCCVFEVFVEGFRMN